MSISSPIFSMSTTKRFNIPQLFFRFISPRDWHNNMFFFKQGFFLKNMCIVLCVLIFWFFYIYHFMKEMFCQAFVSSGRHGENPKSNWKAGHRSGSRRQVLGWGVSANYFLLLPTSRTSNLMQILRNRCNEVPAIETYFKRSWEDWKKPFLCEYHQVRGDVTHSGVFEGTDVAGRWSCCQYSRFGVCKMLEEAITPISNKIPVTSEQIWAVEARVRALDNRIECQFRDTIIDRSWG